VKLTNINLSIQINNKFTILFGKVFPLISQVKLIIATKNLIGSQRDVIKQDVYAKLQQKIELDQQDIDILECDFKSHRVIKS